MIGAYCLDDPFSKDQLVGLRGGGTGVLARSGCVGWVHGHKADRGAW
jgi:hypothetical protein